MMLIVSLFVVVAGTPSQASDNNPDATDPSKPVSVDVLVQRLGSPSFATRQRAKEMLQRLGLEAFDSLHKAQFDSDSEIAMSARHLVSSLMVSWSKETDPEAVRDALEDYGAQSEAERSSRLELLAELPQRQGLEALVRLSRFETSLRLSRQAALRLMQQPMSESETQRQHEADILMQVLGENDRQAAAWLRVYAEDLASGHYSADKWRDLIKQQRHEIDAAATQQASRSTVLELTRVCASRAAAAGDRNEALRLATEQLDLIPPTTRDLIDACSWAIDHELHSFVLELRQHHPRIFSQQPVLLYGAAEAMISAGDDEAAEALAGEALTINALPQTDEEKSKMSPKQLEEIAHSHREIAQELQDKGLFRWSEREFLHIIDSLEINSLAAANSRMHFASMLAELLRHRDVVEVLEPLQERLASDDQFANRLKSLYVNVDKIPSILDYNRGLADIAAGDIESAKPKLLAAYELDDANIDILISMYRLDGDEAWETKIGEMLQKKIRISQFEVQQAEAKSRQLGKIPQIEDYVAEKLNGYAWLVSNTEGDYQLALKYSLRSLEIDPTSEAMMDTCGRCYFAAGDLENAVRMQRRAVKLLPHSPPLRRQLAQFEAALAESSVSTPE